MGAPAAPRHATAARLGMTAGRRLAAVLLVVLLAVLAAVGVVLATRPSGPAPPATAAARFVPADALAYVNVSLDRTRPSVRAARRLLAGWPALAALAQALTTRVAAELDLTSLPPSALGAEAALAVLDTSSSTAGSLVLLAVHNRARVSALLASAGAVPAGAYRGIALRRYASGTTVAFIGSFLAVGQAASVRAAIDASTGAPSLAGAAAYARATAGEPAGRVLDAYVSADGVRRLLAPGSGVAAGLGALLQAPDLSGVSAALTPGPPGARVSVRVTRDPALAHVAGSPPRPFRATLPALVPAGSMLMLDDAGLARAAPSILAALGDVRIAGGIAPLLARLGAALRAEGIGVGGLLSLLSGESAVAITGGAHPAFLLLTRISDPATVRAEMASLAVPLQQLFPHAGSGTTAPLAQRQIGTETVYEVPLEPGLELDYAVSPRLLALSTSLPAIAAVARRAAGLAAAGEYRTVLPDASSPASSLLFLDLSQLLGLGEQTGLTGGAGARGLGADLSRIHAVGLRSRTGEIDSTAELLLQIP